MLGDAKYIKKKNFVYMWYMDSINKNLNNCNVCKTWKAGWINNVIYEKAILDISFAIKW